MNINTPIQLFIFSSNGSSVHEDICHSALWGAFPKKHLMISLKGLETWSITDA